MKLAMLDSFTFRLVGSAKPTDSVLPQALAGKLGTKFQLEALIFTPFFLNSSIGYISVPFGLFR